MFLFYEFIVVIKVNILKEVLKKKTRHILDGEDKRNLIQMSTIHTNTNDTILVLMNYFFSRITT